MPDRVLLIDDDERLAAMVSRYLSERGLVVEHRPDAARGLLAVRSGGFDAVVLDVMLPDLDGFEVLRRIRADHELPVLMLTARGDELDRIVGLEMGADDYLPKPFNPRELLARLKAVLRRRGPTREGHLRFGDLEIDRAGREVRLNGELRALTSHQLELLLALVERPGRVMSREALMEAVRGESLDAFDRSIDVHISRIRAAIEADPQQPRLIKTVRGAGYVFSPPERR